VITITKGFNDTGDDKGVGDRSMCSSVSTGLKVNYQKSCLVPINVNSDVATSLANAFGCVLGSTKVQDYAPLIYGIERRFLASAQFLSYAGPLQLVNSILSSLPTYYMCTLKPPVAVIEAIYK
jgi:hypothetical protein